MHPAPGEGGNARALRPPLLHHHARWAESYQKALATHGVTLEVRPSGGSLDNLQRLQSRERRVDIGFVSGGVTEGQNLAGLQSLGSVAYQPLLIFYRNPTPVTRLS